MARELTPILIVDDETSILTSYTRGLRKDYQVVTAESAAAALALIESSPPFPVIISDYNMPEMNGDEFLKACRVATPSSIRVLLSGKADIENVISCINEGRIFRFLLKPCSLSDMKEVLSACCHQYQLERSEKVLLGQTLTGSVQILMSFLSLSNPKLFNFVSKIKRHVEFTTQALNLKHQWKYSIAAMLSHTGALILEPETVLQLLSKEALEEKDIVYYQRMAEISAGFIEKIPRLDTIAAIIRHQHKPLSHFVVDSNTPLTALDELTVGSQLLKTLTDYNRRLQAGGLAETIIKHMTMMNSVYHPGIVALLDTLPIPKKVLNRLTISELTSDMYLADNIVSDKGTLLIAKGQELNNLIIERIKELHYKKIIGEIIQVYC